jgi:ribosomal-protein-alanine N-acetyltransferase
MSQLMLRYMRVGDLSEVVAIDAASFHPPWPERSYRFEINESQVSHMVVLEKREQRQIIGFRRLFNALLGQQQDTEWSPLITGYGGLWKIAEEAHISTIASHPDYRGMGYGELLLVGMVIKAIELGAQYVVLEVRVSNTVAQNLYHKYGFVIEGTKEGYYHYDGEDAYDMRLNLTSATISSFELHYQHMLRDHSLLDHYSRTPHPRDS